MVSGKCISQFKMLWSNRHKEKVPKEKLVDQVAMTKTIDQIFRPKISPPPGIPIDKKK